MGVIILVLKINTCSSSDGKSPPIGRYETEVIGPRMYRQRAKQNDFLNISEI
jgi:hypothetical protein